MQIERALRLCKRLTTMSGDEFRVRTRQEVGKRWDLALAKVGRDFSEGASGSSASHEAKFFFSGEEATCIVSYLRAVQPETIEKVIDQAARICQHRFDLLGYEGLEYGSEIDWHLDAASGRRAPKVPWFRVPYLNYEKVGDSKVTWELSRHQHLVTLAKAYRFTENPGYAEELVRQWYHWQDQNPYPIGINWASSLEVAFRSLSWLWLCHLLDGCAVVPAEFVPDVRRALTVNARHLERYLSIYFSPNTHLLGEAVGLLFIGILCPDAPSARRWQSRGWEIVVTEAQRQVRPDGLYFEQSSYYHTYALDFLLHARILAAKNGMSIPLSLDETLQRMLEALAGLYGAGPVPQFGDDDGGRVFNPRRNQRQHMIDPLLTGAVLFNRPDLLPARASVHEEMVWLLGVGAVRQFEDFPARRQCASSFALGASGIYVMSGDSSTGAQRMVIDAGPHGAGCAGHGHADALSVQIAIDGKEVVVDPGTFVYVDAAGERNFFRGTRSHNTVAIDAQSQAEPTGPFLWKRLVDGTAETWRSGKRFDFFAGSHTGFSRLVDPVIHRRYIFYLKPSFWFVRDVLEGAGNHRAELFWHFAPGSLLNIPGGVRFIGEEQTTLTMFYKANRECSSEIVRSWYSPVYGRRESSPALEIAATSKLPIEFATLMVPASCASSDIGAPEALRSDAEDVSVQRYRFRVNDRTHHVFFANRRGPWTTEDCSSDARFAYFSMSSMGEPQYVICNGSFLDVNGRRICDSEVVVNQAEYLSEIDQDAWSSRAKSKPVLDPAADPWGQSISIPNTVSTREN